MAVGHFDFGHEVAVFFESAEFVHAAERCVVVTRDKFRAYAVDIDFRVLRVECQEYVFVKVVGCEYEAILVSRFVEHNSRFAAQIRQVAAVEADSDGLVSLRFEFVENLDCVGNAAFESVVCVNQKQAVVGINFGVFFKRFEFGVERHNPTVRVRTRDGDSEKFTGNDVGRGSATAYASGASAVNACVGTLRSAKSEFADFVFRTLFQARGFGCDERLVIYKRKERGFHELRLPKGRGHRENRLVGKHHRAFGHGFDVARKLKRFERFQKVLVEDFERAQIRDVAVVEMKIEDIVYRLFESCRDCVGISAASAIEDIEHRPSFVEFATAIAVHHRKLIKVGQQREIVGFDSFGCVIDVCHFCTFFATNYKA